MRLASSDAATTQEIESAQEPDPISVQEGVVAFRGSPAGLLLGCAAVLSFAFSGAASAQSPTIPMPPDLKLNLPAANVQANVARFVGAWARGVWDGVLPHVLVVEAVDSTGGAQVVYAVGDSDEANATRGYRRVTARIVGEGSERGSRLSGKA